MKKCGTVSDHVTGETVLNYNVLYLGWIEIQLYSLQHAVEHSCQVCRYMVLIVSCSLHAPYNMQSNTAVKTIIIKSVLKAPYAT